MGAREGVGGEVVGVEVVICGWGEHSEGAVSALAVVEDLEVFEDRVG